MNKKIEFRGRLISRQRKWQILHPDKQKVFDKRYRDNNKEAAKERQRLWREKFVEEFGMTYAEWRKNNPNTKLSEISKALGKTVKVVE